MTAKMTPVARELSRMLPRLYDHAKSVTRNDPDHEDLVHDVVARLLVRTDLESASVGAYAKQAIRNAWSSLNRGRGVRGQTEDQHAAVDALTVDDVASLERQLAAREIMPALEQIPRAFAVVLRMRAVDEASILDCARKARVKSGTIMSRTSRACACAREVILADARLTALAGEVVGERAVSARRASAG
jgi:RNA polymerase sigma factor (sigma-70 family)